MPCFLQGVGAGTANNPKYEIFDPATPTKMPLPSYTVDPAYLKVGV